MTLMLCYLFFFLQEPRDWLFVNVTELLTGRNFQDALHCVLAFCVLLSFLLSSAVTLYTSAEEPVSHPSLFCVCGHSNLRHLVFLGGTMTHFWSCKAWMCALCICRWVPNGVGGWLPSSEFWQPGLDHKKGLPKVVAL